MLLWCNGEMLRYVVIRSGGLRPPQQAIVLYILIIITAMLDAAEAFTSATDNNVLFFSEGCGFCCSDYLLAALCLCRDMAEVEVFVREVEGGGGEARRNGLCLG